MNLRHHFILYVFLLLFSADISAQKADKLPRSIPEKQGVSPQGILDFLNAAANGPHEFHSFMFLRHGKVVAEGWWKPYGPDLKHTMYSTSKSFTATAVGFAVTEERLSVDDTIVSFFPEQVPDTPSQFLSELSVKNALSMTVGQDPDPTRVIPARDFNWVEGFLHTPIVDKPGSKFLYNSMSTYMLSAIVQRVTGQRVVDYLTSRLFEPLAIRGMDWEVDPAGINTGGWGLRIKTEDMAKFGQLFLQKGVWKGKQIIPAEWIEEASTTKIEQDPEGKAPNKDSSDWLQGYCYQMWRSRNNAYRADGAFGQFIIIMPEQDAVIAITAETPDMQGEIDLVWKHLLPAIHNKKIKKRKAARKKLRKALAALALPLPQTPAPATVQTDISGKTFTLAPNEKQLQSISFAFDKDQCSVTMKTDTADFRLNFGAAKWVLGETTRRGPYLLPNAKANHVGLPPFKIAGSFTWADENTLELTCRYIESPHSEKMIFKFDNDGFTAELTNSIQKDAEKITISGASSDIPQTK